MFNVHFSVSHQSQSAAIQYQIRLHVSAFIFLLVSMKFSVGCNAVSDVLSAAQTLNNLPSGTDFHKSFEVWVEVLNKAVACGS